MHLPLLLSFAILATAPVASAADPAAPASAVELASRLSALRQDGASYVRLRLEINGAKKETLQLQIKQRRTKNSTEVVYQVLFPKERKGESVLLRKAGGRPASGTLFTPPETFRPINDLKDSLLGSDLSYEDVVEDFFGWDQQSLAGSEDVDGTACQILESKPGKADHSSYTRVRTWIDPRRMIPLRIEKYAGAQLVRRIDTTRVVTDTGHHVPANLTVHSTRQNSASEFDGSRIRHDVNYADGEFTPEGLREVAVPRSASE